MARLDRLTEYLFARPGTTLTLDSESPGFYVDPQGATAPVFKQVLSAGQILLLFADAVPRDRSQDFLAGKPIDFVFDAPRGSLSVHLEMQGQALRSRVTVAADGEELIASGQGLSSDPASPPAAPTVEAQRRSRLLAVIAQLTQQRASHLHLAEDRPAFVRVDGRLKSLEDLGPFSERDVREAMYALAPQPMRDALGRKSSFEFSHVSKDSVLHVRGQQGRDGLSVVLRALPLQVPSPASLGVPDDFAHVLRGSGLWIVTGCAGQGTSSTVASLVQSALESRPMDVCMIESPLDYVLEPKRGLVQQLEVGVHAPSFAAALEDARRGDSDLVVVGQLDDAQTLAASLALAERGRLVLGVMHSKSALAAAQKLLDLAPGGPAALASMLRGVFGQSLVPNTRGSRSLCWELLPGTDDVKTLLRAGAIGDLAPLLTRTFDSSLVQLVTRGEVEREVALANARDRAWVEEQLPKASHYRAA